MKSKPNGLSPRQVAAFRRWLDEYRDLLITSRNRARDCEDWEAAARYRREERVIGAIICHLDEMLLPQRSRRTR